MEPIEPSEARISAVQAIAEPLLALAGAAAGTVVLTLGALMVLRGPDVDLLTPELHDVALLLTIQALVFLAVGALLARMRVRAPAPGEMASLPRALAAGCAGGLVALALSAAASIGLEAIGLPVVEQEWLERLFDDPAAVVWLAPWIVLIGPLAEEVFFRGYAYRSISQRHGLPAGVLVSSAMFAAIHFNLSGFLIYLVIGVVLAWVYAHTARLAAPITAHVIVNAAVLVAALFERG